MNPERQPASREQMTGASEAAAEQLEKLRTSPEKSGEQLDDSGERAAEARKAAQEVFGKDKGSEKKGPAHSDGPVIPRITKAERAASYKQTMKRIQSEMSPVQRNFSKVIHNPVVERSSEVIGSTFARPNAVLAGSASALILVTAVYIVARTFGYPLSGFETIGAFTFGWILGLIFDFMKVMITGKR